MSAQQAADFDLVDNNARQQIALFFQQQAGRATSVPCKIISSRLTRQWNLADFRRRAES